MITQLVHSGVVIILDLLPLMELVQIELSEHCMGIDLIQV
jgi:hypothetical protein